MLIAAWDERGMSKHIWRRRHGLRPAPSDFWQRYAAVRSNFGFAPVLGICFLTWQCDIQTRHGKMQLCVPAGRWCIKLVKVCDACGSATASRGSGCGRGVPNSSPPDCKQGIRYIATVGRVQQCSITMHLPVWIAAQRTAAPLQRTGALCIPEMCANMKASPAVSHSANACSKNSGTMPVRV